LKFEILRKNVRELKQKKKRGNGKNTIECHNCYKLKHIKRDCWLKSGGVKKKEPIQKVIRVNAKLKEKKEEKKGEMKPVGEVRKKKDKKEVTYYHY
jgi:hypothetical protein